MSTAVWSAAGCTVAGAAIGCFLPSIAGKVAAGGGNSTTEVRRTGSVRRARILMSGALTSTLMGLFGYLDHGPTLAAWCWLAITGMCLTLVDIEHQRLPRILVGALAGGGMAVFVLMAVIDARAGSLFTALLAATVTLAAAVSTALVAPGQIGGGDVTLLPALALFLGWSGWSTLMLGIAAGVLLTGILAGLSLLVGSASRGTRIPAGPPMILGALAAIALSIDTGAT